MTNWFYRSFQRLRSLFRRAQLDRDLDAEMSAHLDLAIEENLERGLAPAEARRQAMVRFGGPQQAKEQHREARSLPLLETLLQDLRFAFRTLRKSRGFTAIAVLTLTLGIGASTSIFSVVDAVLLRPLPFPHPEQILRIWEQAPDGHRMNLAGPNFEDFRKQNGTFASLAAYGDGGLASISGGSEPARVSVSVVSSDFFKSLGVEPFLGRGFVSGEQRLNGAPAMLVSYGYWQRYLGGARDLSQFHLAVDGRVYSVVGVMPQGFDFPLHVAAWVPSEIFGEENGRTAHNWRGIGRLRDGFAVAQARADLSTIAHRIKEQYGKDVDLSDADVATLADAVVGPVRTALPASREPSACCCWWRAPTSPGCFWPALPRAKGNWPCARPWEPAVAASFSSSLRNPSRFPWPVVHWAFCLRSGGSKCFPQFFRQPCRGSKASLLTHRFFCSLWLPS
ncbi:MAG TPA: ABC transporter permease [Candidatus Acidoferrum sp.]